MASIDGVPTPITPARSGLTDPATIAGTQRARPVSAAPSARVELAPEQQATAPDSSAVSFRPSAFAGTVAQDGSNGKGAESTEEPRGLAKAAAYLRRQGQTDDPDALEQAVSEANMEMQMERRSMRFRIDRDSDEVQILVVDLDRDKIIRSIPPDEMLKLSTKMRELFGIGAMVDESR